MSYAENLSLFLVLLTGIIIVPGVDMVFAIGNALAGGRARGLAATAGIMAGGAVHTVWGVLSAGALLAFPPALMQAMLLAGAAYLAWIGWSLLRSSISISTLEAASSASLWQAFRQGAITCLLNPKAYVFVAAVYPQFVRPHFGGLASQGVVLGAMTAAMQLLIYGGLAVAAAHSRDLLVANSRATVLVGRAVGAVFLAFALATLWEGLRPAFGA
jgi:threonine/homoserine/homoserine lactone efflux protein